MYIISEQVVQRMNDHAYKVWPKLAQLFQRSRKCEKLTNDAFGKYKERAIFITHLGK